jgi:nucleoside-diphosphate-sugar epimerase
MIVGSGLIASAFIPYFLDDADVVVFASGVSNSRECRSEAFLRERQLLMDALRHERFILYFSTCSVSDAELLDTPYVVHKKEMESLVHSSKDYVIFRLPQAVGKTSNSNTLTNYFYKQIMSGAHFQVWRHARRNIIDVDDVALIVTHLVRNSLVNRITTNIACPFSVSIPQLVSIFECVLGKKSNYTFVEAGSAYLIDSSLATEAASQIGIDFDDVYIENLIRKYYGK